MKGRIKSLSKAMRIVDDDIRKQVYFEYSTSKGSRFKIDGFREDEL